jgi:hypothetical protein
MIGLDIRIMNPWAKDRFKGLFNWHKALSKNKSAECVISYHKRTLLIIAIDITMRQDHSGIMVELGLLGLTFSVTLYDTRHWDHTTNAWIIY